MELGTGIFLSTIVISTLLLYRWTRDRWSWRKGLKRLLLGVLLLALLGWIHYIYENRLIAQTSYYDIELGMSKKEVQYIKGKPKYVLKEDKELPAGFLLVKSVDELTEDESYEDFNYWGYQPGVDFNLESYNKEDVTIEFNDASNVESINCNKRNGSCASILGISTYSDEDDVIARLGEPEAISLSDGAKELSYQKLNLTVWLRKKSVYRMEVSK